MLGKPTKAVYPEDDTVTGVNVAPPAEYVPMLATSFVAEYAVVVSFKLAEAVYRAILMTSVVKSCTPL